MGLDDQVDGALSAVAALVRGAITADLGADFITAVYDDPRALQTLTAGKLPALCIYRASERRRRRSSAGAISDVTIQFDYVLPATALEKRSARWPVLSAVWNCIADVLLAGKHSTVDGGVPVLSNAAVSFEESGVTAEYGVADGGGQNYPFLRGRAVGVFTPSGVDVTTLADFLRFHMTFDKSEPVSGDADDSLIELDVTLLGSGS
jgi:hypothetical protein